MPRSQITQFLTDITRWAAAQADILAQALVGSSARGVATQTSDVDIVLISTHPERYLNNPGWYRQFGEVEKQQGEDYGRLTSIRVWYASGLEIEYSLTSEHRAATPLDTGSRQVIAGGMRTLGARHVIYIPLNEIYT